jgi:Coenzyme PQQ synthesis protein D (PqqD)
MATVARMSVTSRLRPEAHVRIPKHVVHRHFPAQTVVLNLQTGRYHGLNPTAGRMLDALGEAQTVAAAARIVADHYRQPRADVERDLCVLCADLLSRGLVELADQKDG